MTNKTRLNEIYPQAGITRNGIFGYMYNILNTPPAWLGDMETALRLDRAFFGKYGKQVISPMTEQYLVAGEMPEMCAEMLSHDIYILHSVQWDRKYALLSLQYNPISNYDMTESESIAGSKSGETSGSNASGGYTENVKSATGTISDTVSESGTETHTKTIAGTETDTLAKTGTETHDTAYTGTRTNVLERVGAERTIESWEGNQTVTATDSGTETESRDVYAFNSGDTPEPANKTERSFGNRQRETVTTNPTHTTETAQRDRNDTQRETFTGRHDTQTDTFTGRMDTQTRTFTGRTDTDMTEFNGRQTQRVTDDSGHIATERDTRNLTETQTGTESETTSQTRTLTRSGNIGVTTSQQMAESEIKLWQWNFYYDVFADVRKDVAIGAY